MGGRTFATPFESIVLILLHPKIKETVHFYEEILIILSMYFHLFSVTLLERYLLILRTLKASKRRKDIVLSILGVTGNKHENCVQNSIIDIPATDISSLSFGKYHRELISSFLQNIKHFSKKTVSKCYQ